MSTGAIFDQVKSNNRMSPINRTHNFVALCNGMAKGPRIVSDDEELEHW
jgi:hypothetical protein